MKRSRAENHCMQVQERLRTELLQRLLQAHEEVRVARALRLHRLEEPAAAAVRWHHLPARALQAYLPCPALRWQLRRPRRPWGPRICPGRRTRCRSTCADHCQPSHAMRVHDQEKMESVC